MGTEFAAAAFGAVLQVALQTAANVRLSLKGFGHEFQKLQRTINQLENHVATIKNGLENYVIINNDSMKMWLQQVPSLTYEADDLLDEVRLEVSRGDKGDSDSINKVFKELNISKRIRDLNGRIEAFIKEAASHFHSMNKAMPESDANALVSSLLDESTVVGRADEKRKMIDWVLGEETEVSVLAIVGMGGIGKTTLAQIVFNDGRVVGRFDQRIWVAGVFTPSTFDVISVTKKIIQSITGESCNISDLPVLQVKLQDLIKGKRFLLVLDGFWGDKPGDWDLLFLPLRRVGCEGNKIIVTTRSKKVASVVRSGPSIFLERLRDDYCWELMKKEAFRNRHMRDLELEDIGKKMAKKCEGLPFVANELGKMLNFKSTKEWNSLQQKELLEMTEGKNAILRSLGPSYFHLPTHLKNCFGYCSIFPRNFNFRADEMVLLWMAEGFIIQEDIGFEYFRELVWNGFFQSSHDDLDVDSNHQREYKMHHVFHDMARLISSNTYVRKEYGLPNDEFNMYIRHLALVSENIEKIISHLPDWYKQLRTLSIVCDRSSDGVRLPDIFFKKLNSVRVLILRNSGINKLCDSIIYLKHLRYLKLCEANIKKLPEEITELCALQTLKLAGCTSLCKLPKSFNKLTNLQHLDLGVRSQLTHMPPDLGKLSNLQTLSEFIVGKDNRLKQTMSELLRRDERYGIGQLKNMKCLRGSLCIRNLDNVQTAEDAEKAMLDKKPHLQELQLEWKEFDPKRSQTRADKKILAGLKPHQKLQSLVIKNYSGYSFPNWLGDPAFQLTSITLDTCPNCNDFPFKSLGRLPLLNSLRIYSLPNLETLDGEFLKRGDGVAPFPRLKVLEFKDMPRLREWIRELTEGEMPRLQELIFQNCPILSVLPSLLNLEELKHLTISRCPQLTTLPQRRDCVIVTTK